MSDGERPRALCRDELPLVDAAYATEDVNHPDVQRAKALCRRCRICEGCLAVALELGDTDGVWGGLTGAERDALLRRRPLPIAHPQRRPVVVVNPADQMVDEEDSGMLDSREYRFRPYAMRAASDGSDSKMKAS